LAGLVCIRLLDVNITDRVKKALLNRQRFFFAGFPAGRRVNYLKLFNRAGLCRFGHIHVHAESMGFENTCGKCDENENKQDE
jgi:hypothetical protein